MTSERLPQELSFPQHGDERGHLVVIEGMDDVPFEIRRIFYIYGSDADVTRGHHANRNSKFVLVNVCGRCRVRVTDGNGFDRVYTLDRPHMGLYLPTILWKEMFDFSPDSILLCLSSEKYDPAEYIRDYGEFLRAAGKEQPADERCAPPLVTCIVPAYGKTACLYEALASALSQDYPRIELIVADDGSDGFPKQDVERFIETHKGDNLERSLVYTNTPNVGIVRNLNRALRLAHGDYFINLSGDDMFFAPTVMSQIVERFERTGVDLLACGRMLCDEKTMEPIRKMPSPEELSVIRTLDSAEKQFKAFAELLFCGVASGSAMYYTREHFERYGMFDEAYRLWEDGPRLTRYVAAGNTVPTAYDILSIRYRDGGISNTAYGSSPPTEMMGRDHETFIRLVTIPNRRRLALKRRRMLIFWYRWDGCSGNLGRVLLMLRYPEKGASILIKKLTGKPIR